MTTTMINMKPRINWFWVVLTERFSAHSSNRLSICLCSWALTTAGGVYKAVFQEGPRMQAWA